MYYRRIKKVGNKIDIQFIRSSSANTWDSYCQQKYFLVYVLGLEDKPNVKTEKGTVVHAVLEILAGMQKSFQDTGKYYYEHPGIGVCECDPKDYLIEQPLTDKEVDAINKSRKNKDTYKDQIPVEYGHIRYGIELVESLVKRTYDYYSSKSQNEWTNIEWRDCINFTWMELDWADGLFDPRKRTIVYPEYPFNIPIEKPWAKLPNGEYLRIKGTIDLITELAPGVMEIVDHKTGQRYDWGKGKIKTYEDLLKDPQLMLYYYAARKSFPEYKSIMFTIFFVRDGGPFTLAFDDDIIEEVEANLRKTFEEIKNCKQPKLLDRMHNDFRCKTLCGFFKTKVDGKTCICDHVKNEIEVYGIEKASIRNRKDGFSVGKYQSPGE